MLQVDNHSASCLNLIVTAMGRGVLVNLDDEAQAWSTIKGIRSTDPNPLLDASSCTEFMEWVEKKHGAQWTWGGYLEDRTFLWRKSYLDQMGGTLHAGIDINLPAGTEVKAGLKGTVIRIDDDTPELHGWGPRVFIQSESKPENILIYAHLSDLEVAEGAKVSANTPIAKIGAPPTNGNWFPHLHIQAVTTEYFSQQNAVGFSGLDGYFPRAELQRYANLYPDPFSLLHHE